MVRASFKVRDDLLAWNGFKPGEVHEIEVDHDAARALVSAEAAGSIFDLLLDGAALEAVDRWSFGVETQEQSEAALAEAMKDGRWQEGNELQKEMDADIGAQFIENLDG